MRARFGVVRLHGTQKGYGMDEIKDSLERLSELSDGEIADLEGRILSSFDKVEKEDPTRETVDTMVGLADALETVRGESTRRTDQQAELVRLADGPLEGVAGDDGGVGNGARGASVCRGTDSGPGTCGAGVPTAVRSYGAGGLSYGAGGLSDAGVMFTRSSLRVVRARAGRDRGVSGSRRSRPAAAEGRERLPPPGSLLGAPGSGIHARRFRAAP